ncbi:MAG: aldehyde ferredoxin oxidoreductase family protein [Candidatus Odinarchaeia archaeon]
MALKGYWGKILRVDLTNEKITTQTLTEDMAKTWIGGVGLAAKIIYDEVPAGADPLGPENVFVFAIGPFQGTGILGSGRFAACAKSPLTGIWGESLGGGYNAEELKKAGFDAIVVTGKAEKPVYLWVHDGEAELRDASHLWGKDSYETEDALKKELNDEKVQVAPIGQAAENLVRYAGLICNYGHGCAGRVGMGAVMGSKNLKAIAFRGTMRPEIADPEGLNAIKQELLPIIKDADFTKANRELGQAMAVIPREENGLLPIKNFTGDRWPDGAKKIGAGSGGEFNDVLKPKPEPCSYCIMGCHRRVTIKEPEKYAMDSYGPEYETVAMIGSDCLIDNLLAINKANELCNRYSLDTIEFGAICAFAMEAYELGKITKEDLGFELKWGDGDAMLQLLHKIAKREGEIPRLLGEGLKPAGEKLGCPEIALHVNGAAVPAHDPRAFFSMAVETATSTRGACHLHGFPEAIELGVPFPEAGPELAKPLDRFAKEKKGLAAAKYQDRQAVNNSLVWCFFYEFSGVNFTYLTKLLNAVTGWNLTPQDLLKTGERIINLQRMFNLKHGLNPAKDDWLPKRLLTAHKEGGAAGKVPPLKEMLEEYYQVKDWPNGIPSEAKLKELGLDFAIKDLPK